MLVPAERGSHVAFVDGDGQEHVVVIASWPWLTPHRRARRKLERWKRDGYAFYTDPLTLQNSKRR